MKGSAERQARLRARRKAQGLIQATLFVPAERLHELEVIAKRMRDEMSPQRDLLQAVAAAPVPKPLTPTLAEQRAIDLARAGVGYRRIKKETGLPERACRRIIREYRQ